MIIFTSCQVLYKTLRRTYIRITDTIYPPKININGLSFTQLRRSSSKLERFTEIYAVVPSGLFNIIHKIYCSFLVVSKACFFLSFDVKSISNFCLSVCSSLFKITGETISSKDLNDMVTYWSHNTLYERNSNTLFYFHSKTLANFILL